VTKAELTDNLVLNISAVKHSNYTGFMPHPSEDSPLLSRRPRLAKRVRLQIDPVSAKPVLLNQESVVLLNKTGYEILLRCDGTRSLAEIIEELGNQYPAAKATLAREVLQYAESLHREGLLEWI
jgi:pyrroloquinoline quinone biosynthesis protein D